MVGAGSATFERSGMHRRGTVNKKRIVLGLVPLSLVVALLASSCVLSGSWTATAPIDPSPVATSTQLTDVSCASATMCLAVGYDLTPAGGLSSTPMIQRWNGTTWT